MSNSRSTHRAKLSDQEMYQIINLYRSGQMRETEDICRKLIDSYPTDIMLLNVLGAALQAQTKTEEAVKCYTKAIALNPSYSDTYNNRGVALKCLGRFKEAVADYEIAIRIKPDYAEAYSNLANAQISLNDINLAISNCEKAIQLNPKFADPYNSMGSALHLLGKLEDALSFFNRCIELNPNLSLAHANKGRVLRDLGCFSAALNSIDLAIEYGPEQAEYYNSRGTVLFELKRPSEAVSSYSKATLLRPNYADAYTNRGNAYLELGELDRARADHSMAIQIQPHLVEAHHSLSLLKKYNSGDLQIEIMEELLRESKVSEFNRMILFFTLAKAYEDLGQLDKAFDYLLKGNRHRRSQLNYCPKESTELFTKIKDVFAECKIEELVPCDGASADFQPIFILGMPRSGTSLVEQILASHSLVHGAGELETLGKLGASMLSDPEILNPRNLKLNIDRIKTRNQYIEAVRSLNTTKKIITDKMPINFLWIGLIQIALPEAKIIHVKRDPRATCWSVFKSLFSSDGNRFAYDLEDIAEYYIQYRKLMSFWHKLYPGKIYELNYEELTENQEIESRKLLEFCDLHWEESCLNFHMTQRVVNTASSAQVRKQMFKGSSYVWKKYETLLSPYFNRLIKI